MIFVLELVFKFLNEESSREVTLVSYGNETLRAPYNSEIE